MHNLYLAWTLLHTYAVVVPCAFRMLYSSRPLLGGTRRSFAPMRKSVGALICCCTWFPAASQLCLSHACMHNLYFGGVRHGRGSPHGSHSFRRCSLGALNPRPRQASLNPAPAKEMEVMCQHRTHVEQQATAGAGGATPRHATPRHSMHTSLECQSLCSCRQCW